MVCQVYELRNVACDGVWKKDAKKRARQVAEMRRGWDRLGVLEHVFFGDL